jgi:ATP/maltotriose-dependent transcriptional regulator MalT/DNA-binding SARP family transcriptional activator
MSAGFPQGAADAAFKSRRMARPGERANTILRVDLLARLSRAAPRLLALVAPAGFGKSTLARQYVQSSERFAICDCAGVVDELDLARRLLPALAEESPEREAMLTQREMLLGNADSSPSERVELAMAAWQADAPAATFVFENAEHIVASAGARDLFARLLATPPGERTIVICSRESMRMHLSRFAAPHEIVTLRAADLSFTPIELNSVFAGLDIPPATIERIATISQGWPIAVLLLARFATEGRLGPLLDDLDDVAFEELHHYLADQVLGSLSAAQRDALFACAAIPHATESDLALALDAPPATGWLAAFVRSSPFIARSRDGICSVHPLLQSMLLDRADARRAELLAAVAGAHEASGNYLRAAELHLARRDRAAAASALGRIEVIDQPSPPMGYARVLAELDRSLVLQYPRLWGATALFRLYTNDARVLLEEADAVWNSLPAETPNLERFYCFFMRPLFMSYIGRLEEALALIDEFAAYAGVPRVPTEKFHGYVLYMRSLMTARLGRLGEAEREAQLALPFIKSFEVMASGTYINLGADIARVRGEREREREYIERALEHVRRSEQRNFVAFDLTEATFGAWLAGENELAGEYAAELELVVESEGVHAYRFFAHCARGRFDAQPGEADMLKWVACGHLIAAGEAPHLAEAKRRAQAALDAARAFHAPFTLVLAELALAEFSPEQQAFYHDAARETAAKIDSPRLHEAVRAIAAHEEDLGMLAPFIRRMRRLRTADAPAIEVELIAGGVRVGGVERALPDRELALIFAVARRREHIGREQLQELLWPELEPAAARNALNVCAHRLRQHLGDDTALLRSPQGFRLRDDVRVDLPEVERIVAGIRKRGKLDDAGAQTLRRVHRRLAAERPDRVRAWEWFGQIERRILELRCEVMLRLASHALEQGRNDEVLALTADLSAYDPCDEPARELAIRALLANGDRAGALRQYRQYRDVLRAELECDPSPAIGALVGISEEWAGERAVRSVRHGRPAATPS